ncbi:MAG: hypothetical protein LAO79_21165 [Acidobacteriia bacterium]|nr:hypothetical protein [Terriglobia bacterium]
MKLRAIFVTCALIAAACSRTKHSASSEKADPVRITQFYASPRNPPQVEKTLVCYGVANAREVRLDPPVERLWPSIARCFDFVPAQETKFTLIAANGNAQVTQSIDIVPGPPAVKLIEVSINKIEAEPGEQITVCYKAKNAVDVEVRPGRWLNPHTMDLGCVSDRPQKNTTYVVRVTGAGGDLDTEKVTVKIK